MINNSQVASVAEFERELKEVPKGKSTPLLVLRRSGPIFLALRVPEE
jgi:serine protease Do